MNSRNVAITSLVAILFFVSCSTEPAKINYGKDQCADCSMTIMDPKFGAEIVTRKGKIFKFDDAHCVAHFLNSGKIKKEDIARTMFIDFENNNQFIDAAASSFVVSPQLKSPMNGNAIAFSNKQKSLQKATETGGSKIG